MCQRAAYDDGGFSGAEMAHVRAKGLGTRHAQEDPSEDEKSTTPEAAAALSGDIEPHLARPAVRCVMAALNLKRQLSNRSPDFAQSC